MRQSWRFGVVFFLLFFLNGALMPVWAASPNCSQILGNINVRLYDSNALFEKANWLKRAKTASWVENGVTYRLQEGKTPRLEISEKERTLTLPYGLSRGRRAEYFLPWIIGSKWHPYNSVLLPTERHLRIIRAEQIQAVRVIQNFLASRGRRLLIVAPPGYGKTLVVRETLNALKRNSKNDPTALYIADRRLNLDQAQNELEAFPGTRFSTTAALRRMWSGLSDGQKSKLADEANLIFYDESHHSGAPIISDIINEMQSRNSRLKLVGLTATPVHWQVDLQDYYDGNSYWPYLEQTFNRGRHNPQLVVTQLIAAIDRGHLTPLDQFYLLTKELLGVDELFIHPHDDTGRAMPGYVIDPRAYGRLISFLMPAFLRSHKIALIANNIAEADRLTDALSQTVQGYKISAIHSGLPRSIVSERFSKFQLSPENQIVVAVKMLDEAADVPGLDLLVDLNRSASVIEALQRIGRLTRLSQSKTIVRAISFIEITAVNSEELLKSLDLLKRATGPSRISNASGIEVVRNPDMELLDIPEQEIWTKLINTAYKFRETKYKTLIEASNAAQNLNISSYSDYLSRYKEDPRLPYSPQKSYRSEWKSWADFLGLQQKEFYKTYSEASRAARRLKISSSSEYPKLYKRDPKLPSVPKAVYSFNWQGWHQFLGKKGFYKTLPEAERAVRRLRIKTERQYKAERKRHPRLPSSPENVYDSKWQSWPQFLHGEHEQKQYYRTISRAAEAAQRLNIKSFDEYRHRYKEDPKLPSHPPRSYISSWQGWPSFLGKTQKYKTLSEATKAVQRLNIQTPAEYLTRYREDPRLPYHPEKKYSAEWQSWPQFLRGENRDYYKTLAEASAAAQKLKISSFKNYLSSYKKDPKLPARPDLYYSSDWQNWLEFLGRPKKEFYKTITEASAAARRLKIRTRRDYYARYKLDSKLSSAPNYVYAKRWTGWAHFLDPVKARDRRDGR